MLHVKLYTTARMQCDVCLVVLILTMRQMLVHYCCAVYSCHCMYYIADYSMLVS
jgi:hypothetical protein